MANLAQIAGSYTFQLLGMDAAAESTFWSTVAGVIWIILMTYICYRGIEVSARMQYGLLGIELVILVIFSFMALIRVYTGNAPDGYAMPSLSWLWPSGLSLGSMVTATLIAVFIYWGWDTAVSVNEESDNPETTPGRAAIISTLLLLVTYALVSIATVAFGGVGDTEYSLANESNSNDVFAALGPAVFGDSPIGHAFEVLLIISVLTSAAASTQTTILPTARTALSMGAYKALPSAFARVHPRYLTPSIATIMMGIVSILFYVILTTVSENVLADSIAAVGLMIAFYYGITGFACVWYYRRDLTSSWQDAMRKGIMPALGGLMLLGAFVIACVQYADPSYGSTTVFGIGGVFVLGMGALLLGFVAMVLWNVVAPAFFRGETLSKRMDSDLILVALDHEDQTLRLPDSGLPEIIIAPDLSNLPPGMTAMDLETGRSIDDTGELRALNAERLAALEAAEAAEADRTPDSGPDEQHPDRP
jgi:amino acid transporter